MDSTEVGQFQICFYSEDNEPLGSIRTENLADGAKQSSSN
jgi:hypothetical protein